MTPIYNPITPQITLLLLLLLLLLASPGVVVEQVVEDEEGLALPHLVADLGKQPAARRARVKGDMGSVVNKTAQCL
jgi:hypothetical protein